jgi:hypothetical protein
VHEKDNGRKLLLTQGKSVKIYISAPITVNFGTCNFQAWRLTLEHSCKIRYRQHLEHHFEDYFKTMPIFPSFQPFSGKNTQTLRFGERDAVYKQGIRTGTGLHASVYQVRDVISGKVYAAKEPHYNLSDLNCKRVERYELLEAKYYKLVELKHVSPPLLILGYYNTAY